MLKCTWSEHTAPSTISILLLESNCLTTSITSLRHSPYRIYLRYFGTQPVWYPLFSFMLIKISGYVGRINYVGQNTTLTFNQTLSNNTTMFYFTHTSIPNAWSEYFLVARASARKNNNDVVVLGSANTVITKDRDTIAIGVSSGTGFFTNYDYTSTWVDLAIVRRNQAHIDTIPNGDYQSYFTVKSNRLNQPISITLYGNRYIEDPATAWLSIFPDQVSINLLDALGGNKVEVVEAEMHLEGDDYGNNYGVTLTFMDSDAPESNTFKCSSNKFVGTMLPGILYEQNN